MLAFLPCCSQIRSVFFLKIVFSDRCGAEVTEVGECRGLMASQSCAQGGHTGAALPHGADHVLGNLSPRPALQVAGKSPGYALKAQQSCCGTSDRPKFLASPGPPPPGPS